MWSNGTLCSVLWCVQEELKMVGLVSTLQVEEEVRGREEQLNTLLKNKKTMKVHVHTCIHVPTCTLQHIKF